MARARSQSARSVSLFPFLAVLVCAMGALILILIVTTRRIHHQTLQAAAEKSKAPERLPARMVRPLRHLPETKTPKQIALPVPNLRPNRPSSNETDWIMTEYAARVRSTDEQQRGQLQLLQEEQARLARKTVQLAAELKSAESSLQQARSDLNEVELARSRLSKDMAGDRSIEQLQRAKVRKLSERITLLRRKIEELKLQQAQTSSKFAIVPFDGRTGTTRRPIFIECTGNELTILPEGIAISAEDLKGFTSDFNPLLAGTEALVNYWAAKKRIDSTGREPEPYVLLLVRPGGTIGFYAARKMLRELNRPIGYELILNDWKLDFPKVDPQAQAVCRLAVDRALAQRREALQSTAGGGHSSGSGRYAPRAGGNTARYGVRGTEHGSGNSDDGSGGRIASGRQMRFNRRTGRFEVIEPGNGGLQGKTGKKNPLDSGFGPIVDDSDGPRGNGTRQSVTRPGGSSARRRSPLGTGSGRRQPFSNGGTGGKGGPGGQLSQGERVEQRGGSQLGDGKNGQQQAGHRDGRQTGKQRGGGESQQGQENEPGKVGNRQLWPLQAGNRRGGGQSTSGNTGRNGPAGTSSNHGTSGGVASGGSASGQSSPGAPNFTWQSHRKPAGHQKIRWGLSNPGARIGFEKDVQIWCATDRVMIGDRQTIRIAKDDTREQLFRSVVFALDAEARSWGKPPDSFYWVPHIQFVVSPGGNQHFARLNRDLQKLGLQTEVQYRLESTAPTQREVIDGP